MWTPQKKSTIWKLRKEKRNAKRRYNRLLAKAREMTENEGCTDPSINEDMDTLAQSIEDNLDTQSLPVFHKIFWEQQVLACN